MSYPCAIYCRMEPQITGYTVTYEPTTYTICLSFSDGKFTKYEFPRSFDQAVALSETLRMFGGFQAADQNDVQP